MSFRRLVGVCASALAAGILTAGLIAMASAVSAPREPGALAPGGIGALSEGAPPGFAGSTACADCHAAETRTWLASQHAHAMSRAEPQTVLGNFDDARVTHPGSSARFFRDGPRFMVETEGADGKTAAFEITDTFGVHPCSNISSPSRTGGARLCPSPMTRGRPRRAASAGFISIQTR